MKINHQVIISDTFLDAVWNLDRKSQRKVRQSIKRFAEDPRGNGFQVHDLDRTNCDPSFRSARIDQDLRLIFSQNGNNYILLYVDHHDQAYKWAEGRFLEKSKFGSLYINNTNIVQQRPSIYDSYAYEQETGSILSNRGLKAKDLIKLGIHETIAHRLMKIDDEDELIFAIEDLLPELQEAILDLATGSKSLTEVYAELTDEGHTEDDSIEQALTHKDSKRRFYILEDSEELQELIDGSNEKWKWFLHPKQEFLVRSNYNGPVLVEGGPGTGKTVVAIHRAVHLVKNVFQDEQDKVLICTFSRKLARYLEKKIEKITKSKKIEHRIDVKGVDAYLRSLAINYGLLSNKVEINVEKVRGIIRQVYQEMNPTEPLSFYQKEYEEIIQGKAIRTWDEYRSVSREGLGKALQASAREKVWTFFERVMKLKNEQGYIDFEDLAYMIIKAVTSGAIPKQYASIIIDEAQDLTAVKIRALSLLSYGESNNLMILSDQNQRIFRLMSWKRDAGIHIVGRTYYLSLNYRTTKQIREYADLQFIDTSMEKHHIREYKSLLSGPEPTIREFNTNRLQYDYLVKLIKELLARPGFHPHDICIITPTDEQRIAGILDYEEISHVVLKRDTIPGERRGVCISTLHGCKGLEFRVVIMTHFEKINLLYSSSDHDDYYENQRKQQIECLKYVSMTRAREELFITYVEDDEVE